jgi:hypothetical protein
MIDSMALVKNQPWKDRRPVIRAGFSHGPRAGRNGYQTYGKKKPSIMQVIAV